nr:transporter [Gemmatirosa kalamazoonensis]
MSLRSRTLLRTLAALLLVPLVGTPAPLAAQGLRDRIAELFIFGSGEDPLFLAGSADPSNPITIQAHGTHFVPSSAAQNGSIIGFLVDAIGTSVANTPIGSTSGGVTFRFEGGIPVKTSTSAGPIFAERATTLGRGRVLAGATHSAFRFTSLRGVPLSNVQLAFTHENVDFAGCDTVYHDSCKKMGVPALENDVIDVNLALDMKVSVTSLYVTYGVSDRLDVSAVVPIVSTSMHGESLAQVVPFGGPTAAHFFAGTPSNPVLTASRAVSGSATGLGDVAVRAKLRLADSPRASLAVLAESRFATGSADDLLGSGAFMARGLAVLTGRAGDVSPHANLGYMYRGGGRQNDAVLATAGFDQRVTDQVTLAADVVSELQVGTSRLRLPQPVVYDAPFRRTVTPTSIPDERDDIVSGSFGFKVMPRRDVTLVLNALVPLNRGGLRADRIFTGGAEVTF